MATPIGNNNLLTSKKINHNTAILDTSLSNIILYIPLKVLRKQSTTLD